MQVIGIGIVMNQSGEILIDKRLDEVSFGGMWEFPGGKKKKDELIVDAIEREIKEELSIVVKVGSKLIEFDHDYGDKTLKFIVHICKLYSGEPKALESQKFLWVAPEELPNYHFPEANDRIINALYKYLQL